MTEATKVTLSDCGKALSSIEAEMQKLEREMTALLRRMDALRTQGAMIAQLARMMV